MLAVSVDHYADLAGERNPQTLVSCRHVGHSKAASGSRDFASARSTPEAFNFKPTPSGAVAYDRNNPAPAQRGPDLDQLPKLIPITEGDIAQLMVTSGALGNTVTPVDGLKPNVVVIREWEPPAAKTGGQFKDDTDCARPLDLSVEANPLNLSMRESVKHSDVTTDASRAALPTGCPPPVPCLPPLSASNISTSVAASNCPLSTGIQDERCRQPVCVAPGSPQRNNYNIYMQPTAQEPVQQPLPNKLNSVEQHHVQPLVQQKVSSPLQLQPTQHTQVTMPQPIHHSQMSVQQQVQQPISHAQIPIQQEVQQHIQQPTPHPQISAQQQIKQPTTHVQSCAQVQVQQSVNCVQQANENRAGTTLQPHVRPFLHMTAQHSEQQLNQRLPQLATQTALATTKEQPTRRSHYHQHHPLEGSSKLHSRVIMTDKEQHTEEHLKRWQLQIRDMQSYAQQQQQQAALSNTPEARDLATAMKRPALLEAQFERKRPCLDVPAVPSEPGESTAAAAAAGMARRQNGPKRSDTSHLPRDILFLVCNICGRSYGNLNGMKRHLGRDHGIQFSIDKICVETISDYKRNHRMSTVNEVTDNEQKNDDVTSQKENGDDFGRQPVVRQPDQWRAMADSSQSPDRPEVEPLSSSPSCYTSARQRLNLQQQPMQRACVQSCEPLTIDLTASTDSEPNTDGGSPRTPPDIPSARTDGSPEKPEVMPDRKLQPKNDLRTLESAAANKSFLLSIVDMLIERCYDSDQSQSDIYEAINRKCALADRKSDSNGSNQDNDKESEEEKTNGTNSNVDKNETWKQAQDSADRDLHS